MFSYRRCLQSSEEASEKFIAQSLVEILLLFIKLKTVFAKKKNFNKTSDNMVEHVRTISFFRFFTILFSWNRFSFKLIRTDAV